jgi:hypothetical protein
VVQELGASGDTSRWRALKHKRNSAAQVMLRIVKAQPPPASVSRLSGANWRQSDLRSKEGREVETSSARAAAASEDRLDQSLQLTAEEWLLERAARSPFAGRLDEGDPGHTGHEHDGQVWIVMPADMRASASESL